MHIRDLFRAFLPRQKDIRETHYLIEADFFKKAVEWLSLTDEEKSVCKNPTAARWDRMARWVDESQPFFKQEQDRKNIRSISESIRNIAYVIEKEACCGLLAIEKAQLGKIWARAPFLQEVEKYHVLMREEERAIDKGMVAYLIPHNPRMAQHFEESRAYFAANRDAIRTYSQNGKEIAFVTPPNDGMMAHFKKLAAKIDAPTFVFEANADMEFVCDTVGAIRHFSHVMFTYFREHPEVSYDYSKAQIEAQGAELMQDTRHDEGISFRF